MSASSQPSSKRARSQDGGAAASTTAAFDALLARVPAAELRAFSEHVFLALDGGGALAAEAAAEAAREAAVQQLRAVAAGMRAALPVSGSAPGEACTFPPARLNCTERNSAFVDSFLYDDDDVDDLCASEPPRLARSYCTDPRCGYSRATLPLNFLSHSLSVKELEFIFSPRCLGDLTGRTVCDVGSRLGAVLFGGCLLSDAAQLVGVERQSFFCELQRESIQRHGMQARTRVLGADICSGEGRQALRDADVVVLHNVFEFFGDDQEVSAAWECIRSTVSRKGQRLVVIPGLAESMAHLREQPPWQDWVCEIPLVLPSEDGDDDDFTADVHLYAVRG